MRTQKLVLKFLGFLKSYALVVLVIALMFFQLSLVAIILSIDSVVAITQSFVLYLSLQLEFLLLYSFIFCCVIWYLYRPLIVTYLYIKNNLHLPMLIKQKVLTSSTQPRGQHNWIPGIASKISRKLSIKTPRIIIDTSLRVNAKILPGFIHAPLIVLTQGLLDKLTPDEIEAVLAHELAHEAMQDTYSMSVTDLIIFLTIWVPVYICHIIIDYVIFYRWRSKNIGFIMSLLSVLFMYGFLSFLVLNTLNRRFELRADKLAMTLVNLQSFLSALHRVHSAESNSPNALEWCVALLPKVVQKFALKVFLSHPSIPTRIQALQ